MCNRPRMIDSDTIENSRHAWRDSRAGSESFAWFTNASIYYITAGSWAQSDRMTKKNTPPSTTPSEAEPTPKQNQVEETPFEAAASICSVLVVGLFILTFLAQNFVIPSGSMEQTLLVGDHLVVDRVTLAPPTKWMPLVHYREPKHGDIVVFIKPGTIDAEGKPTILFLVKRLVGVPGDHIHL